MTRNDRGFTLIELLVAAVILTVAFVPLVGAFVKGRAVSAAGWNEVAAVSLAQGKMEELKCLPFHALADQDPAPFPDPFDSLCYETVVAPIRPGLVEIAIIVTADSSAAEVCTLRARRACR